MFKFRTIESFQVRNFHNVQPMTIKLSKHGVPAVQQHRDLRPIETRPLTHGRNVCPTLGNMKEDFPWGLEGLSSSSTLSCFWVLSPQPIFGKITEDFRSGREGSSHGTGSASHGGKVRALLSDIPNFRYLNSSKPVMPSNLMRKAWNEIPGKHMQAGNNPVRRSTERVVF